MVKISYFFIYSFFYNTYSYSCNHIYSYSYRRMDPNEGEVEERDESMEETTDHERKEETGGTEEEMEEGEEQQQGDTVMEGEEGEEEGEEDSSILDTGPEGEMEGELGQEEVERLLKEGEVSQEEQGELSSEEILRNYIGNELTENEENNLTDLNIKSPKDFQSDDERFESKLETMENANDSDSCKISNENSFASTRHEYDSTTDYQGESEHQLSSKATNKGEVFLVEDEDGEEEGEEDEVKVMKEVKGGEEEQESGGGGEKSSKVRGGQPMATANICC